VAELDVAAVESRCTRPNLDGAAAVGIVGMSPVLASTLGLISRFVGEAGGVVCTVGLTLRVRFSSLCITVSVNPEVAFGLAILEAVGGTARIGTKAAAAPRISRVAAVGAARVAVHTLVVEHGWRRGRRR